MEIVTRPGFSHQNWKPYILIYTPRIQAENQSGQEVLPSDAQEVSEGQVDQDLMDLGKQKCKCMAFEQVFRKAHDIVRTIM